MAEVKHTPSELHAVFNGLYWDVAVGPHDYSQRVASCHANHVLRHSLEDAERHARLFAAAPDLLEALEVLVAHTDGLALPTTAQAARLKARAALSKATTQQEGC